MMKGFLLLAAMLGMTVVGTYSATGREPTRDAESSSQPVDFGACRYYCGSHSYATLAQCAAVCGGAGGCDQIC
jgi:hypothetical protein